MENTIYFYNSVPRKKNQKPAKVHCNFIEKFDDVTLKNEVEVMHWIHVKMWMMSSSWGCLET